MITFDAKEFPKYTEEEGRFVKKYLIEKSCFIDHTLVLPPNECNDFWISMASYPTISILYYTELLKYATELLKKGYAKNAYRIKKAFNTLLVIAIYGR